MSLDTRTRRRSAVRDLTVGEVFDAVMPEAATTNGSLVAEGIRVGELGPLALECDGRSVTISGSDDVVSLDPGSADPAVTVRVTREGLSNLAQDLQTPMGLAMTSRAEIIGGSLDDWLAWEPTLHALFDGRRVHRPGAVDLLDADGRPLDLDRSFDLGDDPSEMGRFLEQAGFLHVRGVFDGEEMRAVGRDLDRCLAESSPDDGESWWATDSDGLEQAVRVLWFHERSETLAALLADRRLHWLPDLTDDEFDTGHMGAEGLVKPLGITRGLSDLPWHKDCGQGSHTYNCSGLTVGISVTGADRRSGALGVIPGSHRANTESAMRSPRLDLEPILLETATGDVTVHCSDTLHRAHPPVDRPRQVVYTGIPLRPLAGDEDGDWWKPSRDEARKARAGLSDVTDRIDAASGNAR
ncbi:phytanoyl-CoA dioxygenase family protein [Actinospongicola halichondriae]|uniref:phytanoyl-CoA dioxygenase family protein n=1 Tax=Actinospongicola halichondriae TaxID=3236844 RepID=UPI003D3BF9ED